MKKTMWITTLREIKQSLGRYLAVMAIIALGVGLFASLTLTTPFMIDTANDYLSEKEFYDFRLLSTYGFEEEDVIYLSEKEENRALEGAYTYDVLTFYEPTETRFALKMHSMMSKINHLELLAGKLPENNKECVVDARIFGEDAIGKTLKITDDNNEDTLDVLAAREYTITGIVNSSYYIQFERGNTSIGSGKIDGFMYVLPEAFDSKVYTEIFVKLNHNFEIYSDEYEDYIEAQEEIWEKHLDTVAELRFDRVKETAQQELDDARAEFEVERADGEAELADAKKELEDAAIEIQDAKEQLEDARQQIADGKQEIADGKQELIDGKKKIEDGKKEIEVGKEEISSKYAEIEKNQKTLEGGEKELNANKSLLAEKEAELNAVLATWKENQAQVTDARNQIKAQEDVLNQYEAEILKTEKEVHAMEQAIRNGTIPMAQIPSTLVAIAQGKTEVSQGKAEILVGRAQISKAYEELESPQAELDAAKKQLDIAQTELNKSKAQLQAAEKEIIDGKKQLEEGRAALKKAERDLEKAEAELVKAEEDIVQGEKDIAKAEEELAQAELDLAEGEKELAEGEAEYQEGLKEYQEGVEKFEKEIADAEQEIADAQKEINEMDATDCFMLGRDTNVGYVCLENDSQIVTDVATVFPVFFFLIAALVCMTTMNRMIEEHRTQIGVLKALGYSNSVIMTKYLFYSGSAAGLGCTLGFFAGTYFLPKIIWVAYGMMYDMADLNFYIDWKLFIICLVISLLYSMGTTWFSCHHELYEVAAALMRPKAPKSGKRVFLEKIPFIWNHLSFLVKVSVRNVFRYKKRFFMMIVGISGCMALLLTGFGIKDSIADITSIQYEEILLYDMSLSLKDKPNDEMREELAKITRGDIDEMDFFMETSVDLEANGQTKSIYLIVPENQENFDKYIDLHTIDGEPIAYPKTGEAVISHKIAETFGIKIGDSVHLTDENHKFFDVKISGICKNFINSYIFMSEETCTELWERPEFKTVYINVPEENDEMYQLSAALMDMEETTNITITKDSEELFGAMMSSLDYIIVVVIGCAAALAFIVLYNLTNINITERIREIATIKVLGFYKKETATYVFRENLALTGIGAFVGLFVGKVFHAYVMSCINIDIVAFDVRINPISYVYSVLLTFVFAWIVNMFMSGKLEKISMTESLKSVD